MEGKLNVLLVMGVDIYPILIPVYFAQLKQQNV